MKIIIWTWIKCKSKKAALNYSISNYPLDTLSGHIYTTIDSFVMREVSFGVECSNQPKTTAEWDLQLQTIIMNKSRNNLFTLFYSCTHNYDIISYNNIVYVQFHLKLAVALLIRDYWAAALFVWISMGESASIIRGKLGDNPQIMRFNYWSTLLKHYIDGCKSSQFIIQVCSGNAAAWSSFHTQLRVWCNIRKALKLY